MNNQAIRTLGFTSLSDVMPEVDRLMAGHQLLGNWSLGQICNHLATGIILSVDGFSSLAPWPIRKTLGAIARRRLLESGRMPRGMKLAQEFEPKPGLNDRAEVEALRAAIRAFGSHAGTHAPHPFLGPLSGPEWERFHTIHAAHHLGHVLPETLPLE